MADNDAKTLSRAFDIEKLTDIAYDQMRRTGCSLAYALGVAQQVQGVAVDRQTYDQLMRAVYERQRVEHEAVRDRSQ